MKNSNFPGVDEIFHALKAEHASIRRMFRKKELADGEGNFGTDVRLQVYDDGQWAIHTGASDYDQDHRGFWGSGFIQWTSSDKALKELASSLIDDAKESAAQGGDDDESDDDDDEEPSEPEEGDWVMDDGNRENRGGREIFREYGTGKVMCEIEDGEDRDTHILAAQERQKVFPNVWTISDHGNANLLTINSGSFEVIVGNVGTVYSGKSAKEALDTYNEYVRNSEDGGGRAGGESVTLMRDGEPVEEFEGSGSAED